MNSDTIALLVKFLPTILALVIILFGILQGFFRGFRKSLILFIQYVISIVVGLVAYFTISNSIYTTDLSGVFSALGPEFSEASTFYDLVKVLLENYLPDYAALANNPYIEQVILAFVGLGVSLVIGIICLVVVPFVVRTLLYVIYLIFYREGKYKQHKLAEGEEYHKGRIGGMIVGLLRGVVCSILTVSIVSSCYFVLSGGITQTEDKKEDIDILSSITADYDLNAIYQGLKESRTTGVGAIFEAIKIDGTPIDLYYSDLFLTSNFKKIVKEQDEVSLVYTYLSSSEAVQGEIARFCLREELTLIFGLVEDVMETNTVNIVDGKVVINYEEFSKQVSVLVSEYVNDSVLLGEITPLAIIGAAEAINSGDLKISEEIDGLFDNETIEIIKKLDIVGDLTDIVTIVASAIELMPMDESGENFDFNAFNDINTFLNFDPEVVKNIFSRLSEVETLTKFIFPVGVGYALDNMRESIEGVGINIDLLDVDAISWKDELANIGVIYEKMVALDLDINLLMDATIDEESGLSKQLDYIIDLCSDDASLEFKEDLISLVDTVFSTELFSQVGLVFIKSKLAELAETDITFEDGTSTPLNGAIDKVVANLDSYNKESLRSDLHDLISSTMDVASLVPVLMNQETTEETDQFKQLINMIYDVDTEVVKLALLGSKDENGVYQGGIYTLRLLSGDMDGDGIVDDGCEEITEHLIKSLLLTYASDLISEDTLNEVVDWKLELEALIDAVAAIQTVEEIKEIDLSNPEDFQSILPKTISYSDIDTITIAASKSKVLSAILKETLVTNLEGNELLGSVVTNEDIVWMDTVDGQTVVFGELNNILKAFISINNKELDFNNNDSLINALADFIHPATSEDYANSEKEGHVLNDLDYEEVTYFAKSQVIMTVLADKISELGGASGGLEIIIPDSLSTKVTATVNGNPDNWKNWSYNADGDNKQGEFAKLVTVLYYAKEWAVENETVTPTTTSSEEEVKHYPLSVEYNLLQALVYMRKDEVITNSLVLYATTSNMLMNEATKEGGLIKVPSRAMVSDVSANNNIVIKASEISNMFEVARSVEIEMYNNDFSNLNLPNTIEKIGEEEVREAICYSSIFAASAISKLTESDQIAVPVAYMVNGNVDIDHDVWYPSGNSWEGCEINKLLLSVDEIDIEFDEHDNPVLNEDKIKDLLKSLNESAKNQNEENNLTVLDIIYGSDIFRATITKTIVETEEIKVRNEAFGEESYEVTPGNKKFINIIELSKLVDFLNQGEGEEDDIDINNFNEGMIIDLLNVETNRYIIATSNILNITVVDKLSQVNGIEIPAELADINASGWYYSETVAWDESEIGYLLNSVVELQLEVDENDKIVMPEDPTSLLKNLSADKAVTDEEKTPIDVVYGSKVLKNTITVKVEEQKTEGNLQLRDEAYDGSYIAQNELELLIDFIIQGEGEEDDIDINNIGEGMIINLLNIEINRYCIATSNILNITVVDKLSQVDGIEIPAELADINASGWYYSETVAWDESEIGYLLNSVVELQLEVDENDKIIMPEDPTSLLKNLGGDQAVTDEEKTPIDVVYGSKVLKNTITVKVEEQKTEGNLQLRDEAYDGSYIAQTELELLIDFIIQGEGEEDDIDINNIGEGTIINLLNVEINRYYIATSNILNITVVDKLSQVDGIEIPISLVNIKSPNWYPKDNNWEASEIGKLLNSVVELQLEVDENDKVVMPENPSDLLKNLSADKAVTNTDVTPLDVVYSSLVIKNTITVKIEEQQADGTLQVREEAYYGEYILKSEIQLLIDFVIQDKDDDKDDIDINNIGEGMIIKLLEKYENRSMISLSNILNITVVDKLSQVDGIEIPRELTDIESKQWYPVAGNWEASEIGKLLDSVVELQLEVDENDKIVMPENSTDLLKNLSADKAVTNEEKSPIDVVYSSLVIKNTITVKVEEQQAEGNVLLRSEAYDGNYIAQTELELLIDFIIQGEGEEDDIDINNIGEGMIIELINDVNNRYYIATSNILNITVVDKLMQVDGIEIPAELSYVYASGWYYSESVSWDHSEVGILLASIVELQLEVENDKIVMPEDPSDLLKNLSGDEAITDAEVAPLDVVYSSKVLKKTITVKVEEQQAEGNLKVREEAYLESYIAQSELELLIDFIIQGEGEEDDIDINNIGEGTIINLLNVETNRYYIATSNILNITVVDKLSQVDGIEIPAELADINASSWYYSETVAWDNSEIGKLLDSIVELQLEVDENDKIVMPENSTDLLKNLSADKAVTNEEKSPIDVVYSSLVIKNTITVKIEEEQINGNIQVRHEAYLNGFINQRELELLIDFIIQGEGEEDDIDINNIGEGMIIELINDVNNRYYLSVSNILNITVVDKLSQVDGIEIPTELSDIYASEWYYSESVSWDHSEVGILLASIVELQLEVENDKIVMPENSTDLLKNLSADKAVTNEEKSPIDVVYSSKVLKKTITVKVEEQQSKGNVQIREEAYLGSYIAQTELELLIDFIIQGEGEEDDIDINNIGEGMIIELINDVNNRYYLSVSNILNITVVDKLSQVDGIEIPTELSDIYASEWYYSESVSWDNSEVGSLLASIVELQLEVENDKIVMPEDSTTILKNLSSEEAITDAESSPLDVVYTSKVLKNTITVKIEEQQSKGNVQIREEAYFGEFIYKSEIQLLIDFIVQDKDNEEDDVNIDDISEGEIVNLLEKYENRSMISLSNILNITVVDKLTDLDGLEIPTHLQDVTASEWYPVNRNWEVSEIGKLLASIVELQLEVDENDEVVMPEDPSDLLRGLNGDEAITDKTSTPVEVVYASEVLKLTIKVKIESQEDIIMRDEAYVENNFNNYFELIEIERLIEFASIELDGEAISLTGLKTKTVLQLIENEENRRLISESNILNITVVDRLRASEGIEIPTHLQDVTASAWYYSETTTWDNSEVGKLLASIVELQLEVDENDEVVMPEDPSDLLRGLNGDEAITNTTSTPVEVVYASEVLKLTIKVKIESQEDILIRNEAYVENNFNNYFELIEIERLIEFASIELDGEAISLTGLKTKTVLQLIENEENRQLISESNILNITVVDRISASEGIEIPTHLSNIASSAWYYSETITWDNSEVGKLLASVVELQLINYIENDEIIMPEDSTELLKSLNGEEAITNSEVTPLDVAYASEVLKYTIKLRIEDEKEDGTIQIRNIAYEENNSINYFRQSEIAILIKFINTEVKDENGEVISIDLDSLGTKTVLLLINSPDATVRELISISNILNITVVEKLSSSKGIHIPSKFKTYNDVNINDEDWYYTTEDLWYESEIAKLLASVVELQLIDYINNDDEIEMPDEPIELLKRLNGDEAVTNSEVTPLDVAYSSEVLKFTIKYRLDEQKSKDNIEVRVEAYENNLVVNYYKQSEIAKLIQFASIETDKDGNPVTVNLEELTTKTLLSLIEDESIRELIVTSNILNITVVDKLIKADGIKIPSKFKTTNGVANAQDNDWYFDDVNYWEGSEIARLLASVVELQLSTCIDSNDKIVMPEATELLTLLGGNSVTTDGVMAIDVVYLSEILMYTINAKVDEINEIVIRDEAYATLNNNIYTVDGLAIIDVEEIKLLIHFIELTDINIENHELDAEHILGSSDYGSEGSKNLVGLLNNATLYDLEDTTEGDMIRKILVKSNILNISLVHAIAGEEPITESNLLAFPKAYLDSNNVVLEKSDIWYYIDDESTTELEWRNGELYHLLESMALLGIKAKDNDIKFDIEVILNNLLEVYDEETGHRNIDVVYESDTIAMTISKRLSQFASVPEFRNNGEVIYDQAGYRVLEDKILVEDETEALINGVRTLNIHFNAKDSEGNKVDGETLLDPAEVDINELSSKIDELLESSILHKLISDNLLKQTQNVKGNEYGVVTYNYYKDDETIVEVIFDADSSIDGVCYYVRSEEIAATLDALIALNMDSIEKVSSINDSSHLTSYFGSIATNKDEAIRCVSNSAIMSKIFSQIIVNESFFATINMFGLYELVEVTEYIGNNKIEVLTQADLGDILLTCSRFFG